MTSCLNYVRSVGYLQCAIKIKSRYKRHVAAWQGHIDANKSLILDAVSQSQNRNLVVVLGSGILTDIPLKALSAEFDQVELADVIHLNNTRKAVNAFANVGLTTRDITGIAEDLYIHVQTGGMGPIAVPSATFPLLEEANLVI